MKFLYTLVLSLTAISVLGQPAPIPNGYWFINKYTNYWVRPLGTNAGQSITPSGPDCTSPALWTTPILQQQTNDNDYDNMAKTAWRKQHIKNTSSSAIVIKNIKWKVAEVGGFACDVYTFVTKTNQPTAPVPDLGSYSATNTLASTAPVQWVTYTFPAGNEPTIPANTDFYIVQRFNSSGTGSLRNRRGTIAGGTYYVDLTYSGSGNSDADGNQYDYCFEINICQ